MASRSFAPTTAQARARATVRVAASSSDDEDAPAASIAPLSAAEGWAKLGTVLDGIRDLPPSERAAAAEAATKDVSAALDGMRASDAVSRWRCYPSLERRNIFPNELRQIGIEDAAAISRPNDTNDAQFLLAVGLMSTPFLALIVGVVLPGDWGAFGSYLIGGISLAVLAVGSTAPGLLAVAIDRFARVDPAYRAASRGTRRRIFWWGTCWAPPSRGTRWDSAPPTWISSRRNSSVRCTGRSPSRNRRCCRWRASPWRAWRRRAMAFGSDVRGQEADLRDLQRVLNKCEPKLEISSSRRSRDGRCIRARACSEGTRTVSSRSWTPWRGEPPWRNVSARSRTRPRCRTSEDGRDERASPPFETRRPSNTDLCTTLVVD